MKFSIICCTWNSAVHLKESVESVLAQDHPDIEYIFVDGGSTDGTLDLIAAIDRPVKILNDVRGGISRAMNEGIYAATGEIVAHLHSDDFYLHSRVLSKVAHSLEASKAGWCYGRIQRVVDGQLIPESFVAPMFSPERLLRGNFIPHPATFVRRDWILQAGCFDEFRKYAMDYDMWLKLAKMGNPIEIGEPLAAFRVHGGSLSSANRAAAMAEDFRIRLAHSDRNPVHLVEHVLRYWIRKRRLQTRLMAEASSPK
jgi:glycosyltransferase involved in cell wall biosynthesis